MKLVKLFCKVQVETRVRHGQMFSHKAHIDNYTSQFSNHQFSKIFKHHSCRTSSRTRQGWGKKVELATLFIDWLQLFQSRVVSYEIGSVQLGPQQFQMQQKIYLSLLRQC
jgi:hypothetical protein